MWIPREEYKDKIAGELTPQQFEYLESDIPEWLNKFFIKVS